MMIIFFLWMTLSVLFLQIVLLLLLMLRKTKMSKKKARLEFQYEAAIEPFTSYMMDENDTAFSNMLPSLADKEFVLEKLLNNYVAVTKNSMTDRRVKQLSENHLFAFYEKQLKGRSWASRINTLYYIEDFHMQSMTPLLLKRLSAAKKWDEETKLLSLTLASLHAGSVFKELERFPPLPASFYADLFSKMPLPLTEPELHRALSGGRQPQKIAAITYIGFSNIRSFLPLVEKQLQSSEAEVRIQALKAMFRLQYVTDPALIEPFFTSGVWAERMFAARLAGVMKLTRYQTWLRQLLGDPVWRVRYSAAEAFTHFPDGDLMLAHLSEHHPDRFARDMANQWQTIRSGGFR